MLLIFYLPKYLVVARFDGYSAWNLFGGKIEATLVVLKIWVRFGFGSEIDWRKSLSVRSEKYTLFLYCAAALDIVLLLVLGLALCPLAA